ncbi:MAG: VCBS repeat-containing protein, partial [Chitinophagaceae bacterium]|nr:VCBS repeat-containing protein [Chitinophagaceae bacterium]
KEGYELAKYHCSSCHQFVPASSLDKITWEKKTLPPMGKRLGLTILWDSKYVENDNFTGGLNFKDWMKIVDYYLKSAPDKLIIPEPTVPPVKDSGIFSVHIPSYRTCSVSRTVMTAFDTISENFFTSDFYTNRLIKWNKNLDPVDSTQFLSPVLWANFYTDKNKKPQAMFTNVGFMNPGHFELGSLVHYSSLNNLSGKRDTIAKFLARPVHTTATDINNDGLTDYVVCEFGYMVKGGVYILEQQPGGKFERRPLREWPGATMTIAKDFNNDGWIDIMALFAHDLESIRLYTNDQKGSFTETEIMAFPPVNGSTSFQLIDFNKDGLEDILYTCGDNADVSTIFKPYHGVYIFINKGDNKYEQPYFYQVN